jgi:hypothetical protein
MSVFSIYQIQFTKSQRTAINNNEVVPAFEARTAMMSDFRDYKIGGLASDAFDAGHYTHVANITAEDYNDVFHIGNVGPEENIVRLADRMSSLSVGDIIVAEDGTCVVVANMGFVAFSYNPKMVA